MPANADFPEKLAEEIAKQLPLKDIYKDGLAQATKETGGLLADLVKVVRLALAPIQYGALLQDRYRRFIERSAQRVPEERRVSPAPQILGPVLEGIRYEPEGSMNDESFSQLLSRAFDRERAGQAHPSFPAILRTLSEDELKILRHIRVDTICVPCSHQKGDDWRPASVEAMRAALPFLYFPEQALVYCNHIESLGLVYDLVGQSTDQTVTDPDGYFALHWELQLSDFGALFASAVLSD